MKTFLWYWSLAVLVLFNIFVNGEMGFMETDMINDSNGTNVLMVGLTLVQNAADKEAVCLDGSVPGYHLYRGYGSGSNNWIIQLEGGAWCDSIEDCQGRKNSKFGSSKLMEKELAFVGILSDKASENPDFYNWNKVKVRYCDGASFAGDSENKEAQLQFRGKRIFLAVMEDLMAKGMIEAKQALLSGCSAGGLAAILRCVDFRYLFPRTTKVKCMSDAGFFLDDVDISGGHTIRTKFSGVVNTQGLKDTLPPTCTSQMLDPTYFCFFPQYIIDEVETPLFILNSGFDSWQINNTLAPPSLDPSGSWHNCSFNFICTPSQKQFLRADQYRFDNDEFVEFNMSMFDALKTFSMSSKNGVLITSEWAHCQTEIQDKWFPVNSGPNKGVALAVGDWYFERTEKKAKLIN